MKFNVSKSITERISEERYSVFVHNHFNTISFSMWVIFWIIKLINHTKKEKTF